MHSFLSNRNRQRPFQNNKISAWSLFFWSVKFFILAGMVLVLTPIQGYANQRRVGMKHNNTTVKLKINEVLQIELPGNAGTGFQWRDNKLDDTFFVLLGSHKKIVQKDDPRYVGNAYLETWSLKALKAGSSDIRLLYYRPWEGEKMAEKSLYIKVIIEP